MNIGAVILAAGYSSRMDGFKPLMTLAGKTMLARCAESFQHAGLHAITVITGHRGKEVEAEARHLGLESVYNRDYDQGMFSSVRSAVSVLRGVDGFFVLPVDTPLFYSATVAKLLEHYDGDSVLLPVFKGERGHPPLIPARMIADIIAHDGSGGLRYLLDTMPCREIAVWDRGILLDADTKDDVGELTSRLTSIGIGEPGEVLEMARLFMPEKGVAHGIAVAQVAREIGRRLNLHGYALDLDVLNNAGLLHDIGKGERLHEERGGQILRQQGLSRLAGVVAAHRSLPPPPSGVLSENEIVCLADKYVKGTLLVSIRERFAEKLECYAHDAEACENIKRRLADSLALESLVEKQADCSIEEILSGAKPS